MNVGCLGFLVVSYIEIENLDEGLGKLIIELNAELGCDTFEGLGKLIIELIVVLGLDTFDGFVELMIELNVGLGCDTLVENIVDIDEGLDLETDLSNERLGTIKLAGVVIG